MNKDKAPTAKILRVRVLRGFRHNRDIYGPGSVLELEAPIALELRLANKLEIVSSSTELMHTRELPNPELKYIQRQQRKERERDAALRAQ